MKRLHSNMVIFNRELVSLFIVTVAINLAANTIGPFFPLYFKSLGAPVVIVGLLISMINFVQAIFRVPGGLIADRFAKKWIVVTCSLLSPYFSPSVGSRQCLG